jgi:hypothetical protein
VNFLSPRDVLEQVAAALPEECRASVIIIGSLAAGYYYFGDDPESQVRTKDVDCMISPHIKAVPVGRIVAESLLEADWRLREDAEWGEPGTASTPAEELPLVRLHPPDTKEWFLELMASPASPAESGKSFVRLETRRGHFGLCSFGFLSLVEEEPIRTEFGIAIARPEMMALANLLHHPSIGPESMSGLIEGRKIKRSNKDLGRVLALAYLATEQNEDALRDWPALWVAALKNRFPEAWASLCGRAGAGLRQLLTSEADMEEAALTCAFGLLASYGMTPRMLRIAGLRLLQDAVEPLEAMARQ